MSIHTLYHVPKDRQLTGMNELVRVCKTNANIVIAYNWGWHSMLMNLALFPNRIVRLFGRMKKIVLKKTRKANNNSNTGLYFYSHSRAFFKRHKPANTKLSFSVLKSLHKDFIDLYLGNTERSRRFLDRVYTLESKHPSFFGKHGAFPLIILEKTAENTKF